MQVSSPNSFQLHPSMRLESVMLTSQHELHKPNSDEAHRNKLSVMTKPVTHSLIQSSLNPPSVRIQDSTNIEAAPSYSWPYSQLLQQVERLHRCSEQHFRVSTGPNSLRRLWLEPEENFRSKRRQHGGSVGVLRRGKIEERRGVTEAVAMASTERRKAASRKHDGLNKPS